MILVVKYSTVIEDYEGQGNRHDVAFSVYNINIKGLLLKAVAMRLDDHTPCTFITNQDSGNMNSYEFG